MFELPLVSALTLFGLGFVAGVLVALIFVSFRAAGSGAPSPTDLHTSQPRDRHEAVQPQEISSSSALSSSETSEAATSFAQVLKDQPENQLPPAWMFSAEPKRESVDPLRSWLRGVQSATLKEQPQLHTMAAEIDAILQEKLLASALAGRIIRLEELPDFRLRVIVDGRSYEGVEAVPDEAARALIQSAVKEWQRRAGAG